MIAVGAGGEEQRLAVLAEYGINETINGIGFNRLIHL